MGIQEQGLLAGLLRPTAQLLRWVLGQCVLLTSQWDLLRMEEQGLLRNMPALSSLGNVGRLHFIFGCQANWVQGDTGSQGSCGRPVSHCSFVLARRCHDDDLTG